MTELAAGPVTDASGSRLALDLPQSLTDRLAQALRPLDLRESGVKTRLRFGVRGQDGVRRAALKGIGLLETAGSEP